VAVIDDGFDPAVVANYGDFNSALSVNFAPGGPGYLSEPGGSDHGTATSSEIGNSGAGGQPTGIAPNAAIVGVRVSFSNSPAGQMAVALNYAVSVADVVNNSWAYTSFGAGEPANPNFATWYAAVQTAVQNARAGLGTVLVFAAGNNRTENADLSLQIQDDNGTTIGTISDWSLTVWGDNAATVQTPLVYTPEFASSRRPIRPVRWSLRRAAMQRRLI
jgi:subtilisin family serine protease